MSTSLNPASDAYRRNVSGRISVPVAADGRSDRAWTSAMEGRAVYEWITDSAGRAEVIGSA